MGGVICHFFPSTKLSKNCFDLGKITESARNTGLNEQVTAGSGLATLCIFNVYPVNSTENTFNRFGEI